MESPRKSSWRFVIPTTLNDSRKTRSLHALERNNPPPTASSTRRGPSYSPQRSRCWAAAGSAESSNARTRNREIEVRMGVSWIGDCSAPARDDGAIGEDGCYEGGAEIGRRAHSIGSFHEDGEAFNGFHGDGEMGSL